MTTKMDSSEKHVLHCLVNPCVLQDEGGCCHALYQRAAAKIATIAIRQMT